MQRWSSTFWTSCMSAWHVALNLSSSNQPILLPYPVLLILLSSLSFIVKLHGYTEQLTDSLTHSTSLLQNLQMFMYLSVRYTDQPYTQIKAHHLIFSGQVSEVNISNQVSMWWQLNMVNTLLKCSRSVFWLLESKRRIQTLMKTCTFSTAYIFQVLIYLLQNG